PFFARSGELQAFEKASGITGSGRLIPSQQSPSTIDPCQELFSVRTCKTVSGVVDNDQFRFIKHRWRDHVSRKTLLAHPCKVHHGPMEGIQKVLERPV